MTIALFAIACDKDDELKDLEANLPKIDLPVKSRKIDFTKSEHYGALTKQVSRAGQKLKASIAPSKGFSDQLTIVLEDVLFTEYSTTHTYTFKILNKRPQAYIENLVLHYNTKINGYDEYLVQYHISASEYLGISDNQQFESSEKVSIRKLDETLFKSYSKSSCQAECETIYVTCEWGVHNENNIEDWVNCNSYGTDGGPSLYQSCNPCPTLDAGDSGGGGGGGTGPGPTGGTPGEGDVITNPNANEPCESGSGNVGITGSDGCITTTEDIARNNLFDRLSSYMTSQAQADWIVLEADIEIVNSLNSYLDEATYYNQTEYKNSAVELIDFHKEYNWKDLLRQAVAGGITSTAELTHKIYKKLSRIAQQYPSSIGYINTVVDEFREIADEEFDTNPQTLRWLDLFGIWLFELGDYPQDTITFDGDDTTTGSLKQQEGVSLARQDAIDKINNNDIAEPVNRGWTYGQGEFYDGMANGNLATSFLGSYNTRVSITQNPDGSHTLTFTVSNPSTWESATRLRIDNDNDSNHDGIFPAKPRREGIHLGGNVNQIWIWTEIVN